ncbi:MAG: peptidase S53, partial [Rhodoferax sp.]
MAPVLLATPEDVDADGTQASAMAGPTASLVGADMLSTATGQLTAHAMRAAALQTPLASGGEAVLAPMAATSTVVTYTPAQIRTAYALPGLAAVGTAPSAAQAAQLGAGQTIYIVDAYHNPNVALELAAFNTKFGLPGCTTRAIAPSSALPLASAPLTGCEVAVVYSTAAGAMTATAPAYNSGWATEISLDVQWAHATAPMSRIVVIEAADASLNNLLGAVKLANAMGKGIVSMSFGASEGNWTASVDSAFTGSGMTYLAATGDSGAGVSWPSVSPNVVAVGGTSLTYSGTGTRSEVGWSKTGGGTSAYTPTPSYQTAPVAGLGGLVRRTVADLAFNADP